MTDKIMVLKPRISEKSYFLATNGDTYLFTVPKDANKHAVAAAIEAQYKVSVVNVNIANSKGKPKRTVRKGGRPIMGERANTKRAYVTLKSGDSLPLFEAIEDSKSDTDKPTKKDKA